MSRYEGCACGHCGLEQAVINAARALKNTAPYNVGLVQEAVWAVCDAVRALDGGDQ